jgi:hypothetical protein
MRPQFLLVAAIVLLLGADDAKKDTERLQGTWTVVGAEREGRKAPEEFVKNAKIIIKDDTLVIPELSQGVLNTRTHESRGWGLKGKGVPPMLEVGFRSQGMRGSPMWTMIPSLAPLVETLALVFTPPSATTNCQLLLAWLMCLGGHTLRRVAEHVHPEVLPDHSQRHGLDTY